MRRRATVLTPYPLFSSSRAPGNESGTMEIRGSPDASVVSPVPLGSLFRSFDLLSSFLSLLLSSFLLSVLLLLLLFLLVPFLLG